MHPPTGTITDFDFLTGTWRVVHQRLNRRWVASDDWDRFEGTAHCEPRLDGLVNVDQVDMPDRGFSGLTVRVFDRAASRWAIYWVNSAVGRMEPPVFGGFDGTVGTFVGEDSDGGEPVTVRFTWTRLDGDHARWEQAFSRDGTTWETNWIMSFSRS